VHLFFAETRIRQLQDNTEHGLARKLSYRKDDRAMRCMYGCPKNFMESLSTLTATFPEIFNELLFRLMAQIGPMRTKFKVRIALPFLG